jgi:phytoene dehydrogenase-like protein
VITSSGGQVHLSSRVDSITVENGRASGLRLRNGEAIQAKKAVLCNANIWALPKLLQRDANQLTPDQAKFLLLETASKVKTKSFLHLHLGLDSSGLDKSKWQPHYTVMAKGLNRPCDDRNMVAVSNPSVLDDSLVDMPDRMIVHAYGAGNEPYDTWQHGDRNSPAYLNSKVQAAEYLYESVSRALGLTVQDIKERAEVSLIGTPLTHERYLLREEGTYGSGWGSMLKDPLTPLPGLLLCGDR